MGNILADQIFGGKEDSNDVFSNSVALDEELLKEYHLRNERKKEDEKWLKEYKSTILKGLEALGKTKAEVGNFQVSYVVPNKSHFDMDKVLEFLEQQPTEVYHSCTKAVVDEEALEKAIEQGIIDLEALKTYAWVEKYDAPRLTVKAVKK